jgi:hypothetical protein
LIIDVLISAALWHPEPRSAPAAEAPAIPESCTPGTLRVNDVRGGPVDLRALRDSILKEDAKACGFLTAHDPDRNPSPTSSAANAEAQEINVGVQASVCPDLSSCLDPRYGSEADVVTIRNALRDLGYPDAEVRLAEYVGESPEHDVVYGLPLHGTAGCLVSFARMGQGVAPIGPAGTLRNGHCLRLSD